MNQKKEIVQFIKDNWSDYDWSIAKQSGVVSVVTNINGLMVKVYQKKIIIEDYEMEETTDLFQDIKRVVEQTEADKDSKALTDILAKLKG